MQVRRFIVLATSAVLVTHSAMAATNAWRGVNTTYATSLSQTNVNDAALWSGAKVPDAVDIADFYLNETANNWREQIEVVDTFAPLSMAVRGPTAASVTLIPVYLRKDLTLGSLKFDFSATTGSYGDSILRIGNAAEKGWLKVLAGDLAAITGTNRITGSLGSVDIDLTGRNTADAVTNAVNAQSLVTGVTALKSGSDVLLQSTNAPGLVDVQPQGAAVFRTTRWATGGVARTSSGLSATNVTLTLTNAMGALDLNTGGSRSSCGCMLLGSGSRLVFDAPALTLGPLKQSPHSARPIRGSGGMVDFVTPGGAITLADPGKTTEGSLWVGTHRLRMRSDQTWFNPTGLGVFHGTPTDGTILIESIDGGVLTNLGSVAFYWDQQTATPVNTILPSGTFKGLRLYGYTSSGGNSFGVKALGPVVLKGKCVTPADTGATEDPAYSLSIVGSRSMPVIFTITNAALTTANGIQLYRSTTTPTASNPNTLLLAADSAVDIGGDLVFWDATSPAGATNATSYAEDRNLGVTGNSNTVITLRGNLTANTRSLSSTVGSMHTLTLTMVGGTPAAPHTFEVGCGRTNNFAAGTFAIGTVNIGDGTNATRVQLVNDYLNDNQAHITSATTPKSKEGEVLLAKTLAIKSSATLDLNGLGAGVSNVLTIASDAWLDLHTGMTLADGTSVTNFFGRGNQAPAWSNVANRVKDSSNPALTFQPVYVPADTRTYWQARIATRGTIVLLR